jgi:hypothetical protein
MSDKVWVCMACGKLSNDKYGDDPISVGWDVSCSMNAAEFRKDQLIVHENRAVEIIHDGKAD